MRNRPTVAQLIENLPFLKVVDMMLLEGTPGADVARFIHDDQKSLEDVSPKSLTNALNERKKKLRDEAIERSKAQTKEWMEKGTLPIDPPEVPDSDEPSTVDDLLSADGEDEEGDERVEGLPMIPREFTIGHIAKKIYDRQLQGLDELVELEALARVQTHRIDRLVRIELEKNGYLDGIAREMGVLSDTLMKRVAIKDKLGLIDGDQKFRDQLDIKGYSKETSKVLSNPESRHRVVSLMDRLAKLEAKKKRDQEAKDAAREKASG